MTVVQRSFTYENQNLLFHKPLGYFDQILNAQGKCYYNAGHMTKMTLVLIYGKTISYLLPQNHWEKINETWFEASANNVHHTVFKWWSLIDLHL